MSSLKSMANGCSYPVHLLFGPQHDSTSYILENIRGALSQKQSLQFLSEGIIHLPSIWPAIVSSFPALDEIPGEAKLRALSQFFQGGPAPDFNGPTSILLTPLTVISHTIDYWNLRYEGENESGLKRAPTDVQGFCIGFLSAIVVSCARDKTEYRRLAIVAIHLAVCIGALVDLDNLENGWSSVAVRWKGEEQYKHVQHLIKSYPSAYISCFTERNGVTVVISQSEEISFLSDLTTNSGISAKSLPLRGRFHHPSHLHAVQRILSLCQHDQRFQFPEAGRLILPLRSNIDGNRITRGPLHHIALESILIEKSSWIQTLDAALSEGKSTEIRTVVIGQESCVPRDMRGNINRPRERPNINLDEDTLGNSSKIDTPIPNEDDIPASAVAVVGMACRYPDADSLEEFWDVIESGKCAVQPVPESRFAASQVSREPKGPFWGAFLRHPDAFDHRFFGISGREAKSMDPQQRLLLQVAYEAVESSGYFGRGGYRPTDVGCYVGVGTDDYCDNVASHPANAFSATGTLRAFISGRVSHYFGWDGPSMTMDTACSSAAVSIHTACKALQSGECSLAVAGGVNIITSPKLIQNLNAASFLSPTGASKAFDANADGYCRGEGAGIVVLRPLRDAIKAGASILGIIRGSAVNQGSNCSPITVPDSNSQQTLYRRVLSTCQVDPTDVTYIEAHGTGTQVGDPIELESIRSVFGSHRADDVLVGSVKDNIGHTETSSGVAGLLKTILMMQKQTIPRQANFTRLNPNIRLANGDNVAIPTESRPWKSSSRMALINNYGAAGNNAAMVIQEHSVHGTRTAEPLPSLEVPFFISGHSIETLRSYCGRLHEFLGRSSASCSDIAYNLATKQNPDLEYFLTFTSSNLQGLSQQLQAVASGEIEVQKKQREKSSVVLCFGGQNGRTASVSKDWFDGCQLFQKNLSQCDHAIRQLGLPSLFPGIFHPEPVDDIVALHCALFSIQYASAKTWLDCGLKVDRMIGHSFGQLTALCVAGSLSLADGIRLISARAQLIQTHYGTDNGKMLSIEGSYDDLQQLFALAEQRFPSFAADIACYNGPRNFVVAGDQASIEAIESAVKTVGNCRLKRLDNTHAFHSRLMDCILPGLMDVAQRLDYRRPIIPVEACSVEDWSDVTAEKVVQHTRWPVHFKEAVWRTQQRLDGPIIWLEAGSSSPIIPMVRRALESSSTEHTYCPISLASNSDRDLAKATCTLWLRDLQVQFWPFYRSQASSYSWVNLPPYQFADTRHWLELHLPKPSPVETPRPSCSEILEIVDSQSGKGNYVFEVHCTHELYQLLTGGHRVVDQSLCPAALYVELILRASRTCTGGKDDIIPHIEELAMTSPLPLNPSGRVYLKLTEMPSRKDSWKFTLFSHEEGKATNETTHAAGTVTVSPLGTALNDTRLQSISRLIDISRCHKIAASLDSVGFKGPVVYQAMHRVVRYADYYQGVQSIYANGSEAMGHVTVPAARPSGLLGGFCDPVLMDNFTQIAGIHVNCLSKNIKEDQVYVCNSIREILVGQAYLERVTTTPSWMVYTNCKATSKTAVMCDIYVLDPRSGDLVLSITSVEFRSIPIQSLVKALSRLNNSPNAGKTNSLGPGVSTGATSDKVDLHDGAHLQGTGLREHRGLCRDNDASVSEQSQTLTGLRELLGDILGIPFAELSPTSSLEEIGVDSLVATEVLSEIKSRFGVSMNSSVLQTASDVQALAQHISPSTTPSKPVTNGSFSGEATENHISRTPSPPRVSQKAQQVLSDVLEIPIASIETDMSLAELGVDSLVATEILSEIRQRYGITISAEELSALQDVKSLCSRLEPISNGSTPSESPNQPLLAPTIQTCFAQSRSHFDRAADETGWTGYCDNVLPKQMELVLAYIVEAYQSLGCTLHSLIPEKPIPRIEIVPRHEKLKSHMDKILQEAGIIALNRSGVLVRTEIPIPSTPSKILHDHIIDSFPAHTPEHRLLFVTGPRLAECLSGQVDPLSLVFGDVNTRRLLEQVYSEAPLFKSGTLHLTRYLTDIFTSLDDSREIRILELGAGTGGTTKYLIDHLRTAAPNQRFTYTFTDLSSSMVTAARRRFAKYDFMQYSVLNVEHDPPASMRQQYDVILTSNCIHATRDLVKSCDKVRQLLRPDGVLCLVEITRDLNWLDLVFGLLEGWWLFEDGRQHALASESLWDQTLRQAGYKWVDWSEGKARECELLRVIVGSPSAGPPRPETCIQDMAESQPLTESLVFGEKDGVPLLADIYYPKKQGNAPKHLPIALMIHGGGHVMLSRKDIRPKQTQILLDAGFLPVSIDYRLCPEVNLIEGPMQDTCDALAWARQVLPHLTLQRPDILPNGDKVVAVGWSTGGHLAMTLAWTSRIRNISPPEAILAFYCPTDYEDPFWSLPNLPFGANPDESSIQIEDLSPQAQRTPITQYNVPKNKQALGGWMSPNDPRSRIALHMNWMGQTLPVLLLGLGSTAVPSAEVVQSISPLAQIRMGAYSTPTFIIHGTLDDLIPWQQAQRTYDGLVEANVDSQICILKDRVHLFDIYPKHDTDDRAKQAVLDGYQFLRSHV